ncbi:hypothetical protein BH23PLA1_BH23PLA1_26570 [soil metagenome]
MDQPAPRPMPRPSARSAARRFAAEGLLVLLVLASIGGTLALIVEVHRRGASKPEAEAETEVEAEPAPVLAWSEPAEEPEPEPSVPEIPPEPEASVPEPEPEPEPEAPAVDPTLEILAAIDADRAELKRLAAESGRKAEALEAAWRAAERESARQKRYESLARQQAQALEARAELLATEAQLIGLERDILARNLDEARSSRERERLRPGYAILPYRGPNGTWRRPIPVECRNGGASLPPSGPSFTLLELSALSGRSSPLTSAVIRLAAYIENEGAPDGRRVVPYALFIVRPDGIRPYYEARARLEAAGIEYGYELVDQDAEIEFPELNDPSIWGEIARRPGDLASLGSGSGLLGGDPLGSGASRGFGESGAGGTGTFPPAPPGPGEVEIDPQDLRRVLGADLDSAIMSGDAGGPGGFSGTGRGGWDAVAGGGGGGQPFPTTPDRRLPGGTGDDPSGLGIGLEDRSAFLERLGLGGSGSEGTSTSSGAGLQGGSVPGALGPFPVGVGGGGGTGDGAETPGGSGGEPGGHGSGSGDGSGGSQGLGQDVDGSGEARPQGLPGLAAGIGSDPFGSSGGSGSVLDLIVACTHKGVVVHPGGYRLSFEAIEDDDDRLTEILRAIVLARRLDEPAGRISTRLRFLVEPNGEEVYWTARRQVFEAGLDWPTSLQVSEPRPFSIFGPERW